MGQAEPLKKSYLIHDCVRQKKYDIIFRNENKIKEGIRIAIG